MATYVMLNGSLVIQYLSTNFTKTAGSYEGQVRTFRE